MRAAPLFLLLVAAGASPCLSAPVEEAIDRGMAFLAASWKGDAYDDSYLEYVYTGERLECPLPDCRLTYRLLDAYSNLAFLDRAGVEPGAATEQFARGREVLHALVPVWRGAGLYNVQRDAVDDGIALDTYCIIGLLGRDREMADVVAAHLDGDDWLPAEHYGNAQSFRKLADESWCVRLLRFASRPGRRQVPHLLQVSLQRGRDLLGQERPVEFRVNVALHLLYLLNDLRDKSLRAERRSLHELLLAASADPEMQQDLLTQANILEALAASGDVPRGALQPLADRLLRHQEADGGWHSRVGEAGTGLRVFTTMRALLALVEYGGRSGPPAPRR